MIWALIIIIGLVSSLALWACVWTVFLYRKMQKRVFFILSDYEDHAISRQMLQDQIDILKANRFNENEISRFIANSKENA